MNDIEEKFFIVFGIEPIILDGCGGVWVDKGSIVVRDKNADKTRIYPPITDRILLELICILNKLTDFYAVEISYENLKEEILVSCIDWSVDAIRNEELKHQVQSLFREEEE